MWVTPIRFVFVQQGCQVELALYVTINKLGSNNNRTQIFFLERKNDGPFDWDNTKMTDYNGSCLCSITSTHTHVYISSMCSAKERARAWAYVILSATCFAFSFSVCVNGSKHKQHEQGPKRSSTGCAFCGEDVRDGQRPQDGRPHPVGEEQQQLLGGRPLRLLSAPPSRFLQARQLL